MMRLLAAVLCLAACGKGDKPAIRLVTDAEIAAHEAALMKRIAERETRLCLRPVLHGIPSVGPAEGRITMITEQSDGELERCHMRVRDFRTAYATQSQPKPPLWSAADPAAREIANDCASVVEAAITLAVSHVDACSPYQAGVRTGAGDVTHGYRSLNVMYLVDLIAMHRAETDPAGALWLLLDGIRFADDRVRGDAPLIDHMIGTAMVHMLVARAVAILETHPPAGAELPRLIAAVDVLLASQPQFSDTLVGELDATELEYVLAPLKPSDWRPPGGWISGSDTRVASTESRLATKHFVLDRRDEYAIMFLVDDLRRAEEAKACPPTGTLESCAANLARPARPARVTTADVDQMYRQLVRGKSPDEVRTQIRTAVLDILRADNTMPLADYVKKRAQSVVDVATLRIHLELLHRVNTTKQCPPVDDLTSAELEPPGLGGRIMLVPTDDSVEIVAPAWIGSKVPPPAFHCPKPSPKPAGRKASSR